MRIVTKGDVLAAISARKTQSSTSRQPAAVKPEEAPKKAPKQETPEGRVTPLGTPQPVAGSSADRPYTDVPTSQIRRIVAQRLLESKSTIPHMYIAGSVELDAISQLREALKAQGTKISVNDCVIKAAALALAEVPAANARWDANTETVVPSPSVDISIAVATEGGLITPIVKGADQKSLTQISAEVRELAGRARSNKLKPEEFMGGSFSISNLGMFGVDEFSAIINPPQAAIMAVGGSRRVARMSNGVPSAVSEMTVTVSADNRVYDGAVASQFLAAFARNMANPFRLVTN
jgi:pyruvate dehydrogenase E2 component (dihydrolipoamide acetyltransferase)